MKEVCINQFDRSYQIRRRRRRRRRKMRYFGESIVIVFEKGEEAKAGLGNGTYKKNY